MTDFFISYNQADRDWAEWIAWQLEEKGYTSVIQAWDFRGNFVLEMDKAAKEAERTIAVLSPDYVQALFTQPEWAAAFAQDPTSEKNKLIPVRVKEIELKGLLAQISYVDFVRRNEPTAREMLLARVQGLRLKPSKPPRFPGEPLPGKPAFPASSMASLPIWHVPHARNPNFTGREELLNELHQKLRSGEPAALVQAIHGLGGAGKTQIALEYAYRHRSAYRVVWWVRAEQPALLAGDYAALAPEVGLKEQDAAEQAVITEAVRRWLDQESDWLLIFDNAESSSYVRDYLPPSRTGHVIITSRNPAWRSVASPLRVAEMPEREAVEFLHRQTHATDQEPARELAHELGYLPLALEHARAYMEETGQSFEAYLRIFNEHHHALLTYRADTVDYPLSIAASWEVSFNAAKARQSASADLINLCAFLAPDAIPFELITKGGEALPSELKAKYADPVQFNTIIAALRRYSLVEADDETLSVHRLVQAVARDRLSEPEQNRWAETALRLVDAALPVDAHDVRHGQPYGRLLSHALVTVEHAERAKIEAQTAGLLLNKLGRYFKSRAAFTTAEQLLQRALAIREKALDVNHPDVAMSLNDLAVIYSAQGRHKEAEPLDKRALAIREKALGAEHPDVAMSLNNLGANYSAQGRHKEAEPLHKRALAIQEKVLGAEHPHFAASLNNLGGVYHDQGRGKEAEPHLERALAIFEKALGRSIPTSPLSSTTWPSSTAVKAAIEMRSPSWSGGAKFSSATDLNRERRSVAMSPVPAAPVASTSVAMVPRRRPDRDCPHLKSKRVVVTHRPDSG
jgi:tetratricopeptide (TPR) repeat protein